MINSHSQQSSSSLTADNQIQWTEKEKWGRIVETGNCEFQNIWSNTHTWCFYFFRFICLRTISLNSFARTYAALDGFGVSLLHKNKKKKNSLSVWRMDWIWKQTKFKIEININRNGYSTKCKILFTANRCHMGIDKQARHFVYFYSQTFLFSLNEFLSEFTFFFIIGRKMKRFAEWKLK